MLAKLNPQPTEESWFGRVGIAFVIAVLLGLLPIGGFAFIFQLLAFVTGVVLFFRFTRWATRHAIWRLRNRLLVTYTFIAVVPLFLVLAMAGLSGYAMMTQLVLYLATSELDRRVELLTSTAETLRFMDPARRQASVEQMFDLYYRERFQGLEVTVREEGTTFTYPKDLSVTPPPLGWGDVSGIVRKQGQLFGWAHRNTAKGDITVTAPLSPEYLAGLLPKLGVFELAFEDESPARRLTGATALHTLPRPAFYLDYEVYRFGSVPVYDWTKPTNSAENKAMLTVHSRPSMIADVLFTAKTDDVTQVFLPALLAGTGILFLIVQLVALLIGVGMTRTMTSAVHELYAGTQRVMSGDFSHRIPVKGKDQLAELGSSFNLMTENVQQLLSVAKEKERLQSEIEIAREVQGQLYPKSIPACKTLRIKAYNQPARMVSGDYFDYEGLPADHVGFALGDVAGKGISAALLMAGLQSSVRAQWSHATERVKAATAAGIDASAPACPPLSTSKLVAELNLQLYKNTSPEKYATFFLGLYNPLDTTLYYTNAGHLPPLLFRNGEVLKLEIDGTVVGAFPFAEFGESKQKLQPGDLLLCYTDGITEPENAYGEMFGEERLISVVQRNLHKTDDELVETIMDSVFQWTGSPELQDDMTLLLAWQQ